jgi:hypothetical protein
MPPEKKKKQHRARQSGTKADKKQAKKDRRAGKTNVKGQNPKAFGRSSKGITARIQQSRKAEIQERKLHAPLIDRSYAAEEPPPIVVGVVVRLSPWLRSPCMRAPHPGVRACCRRAGPAARSGCGAARLIGSDMCVSRVHAAGCTLR